MPKNTAQLISGHIANIRSVHENSSAADVVEAFQQIDQRRLTRS